jgi:hypothetical protein
LDGFRGRCRQSAVFPSGNALGFNTYPPRDDGQATRKEGYMFEASAVLPTDFPLLQPVHVRNRREGEAGKLPAYFRRSKRSTASCKLLCPA